MCIIPRWTLPIWGVFLMLAFISFLQRLSMWGQVPIRTLANLSVGPLLALLQTQPYMAFLWLSADRKLDYIWDHISIVYNAIMVKGKGYRTGRFMWFPLSRHKTLSSHLTAKALHISLDIPVNHYTKLCFFSTKTLTFWMRYHNIFSASAL